jgi:hypothetical protein
LEKVESFRAENELNPRLLVLGAAQGSISRIHPPEIKIILIPFIIVYIRSLNFRRETSTYCCLPAIKSLFVVLPGAVSGARIKLHFRWLIFLLPALLKWLPAPGGFKLKRRAGLI